MAKDPDQRWPSCMAFIRALTESDPSDEVQLGFTGPLNPGLIKPVGKDNYLYIIMPVRVAM